MKDPLSPIVFKVEPVAKPRQTKSDVWKRRPRVMRYRTFADDIRREAARHRFSVPDSGLRVTFYLPMPKSWSKSKRGTMLWKPHQQTPDIDNLIKSFLDALCGDDCTVWEITGRKFWSEAGAIMVQRV